MKSATLVLLGLLVGATLGFTGFYALDFSGASLSQAKLKELMESNARLDNELSYLKAKYEDLQQNYTQLRLEYDMLLANAELGSSTVKPDVNGVRTISRQYTWYYQFDKWTLSLSVPEQLYDYYRGLQRVPTSDYSIYVTHPYDDDYISSIIGKFNEIAIQKKFTESEKVNLLISFIQSLPYTSDSVTTGFDEYARYPVETLVDFGGDCEDTSILAAALLKGMSYDVVLLKPPDHLAVGVSTTGVQGYYYRYNGRNYYYLETTGEGWEIGEIPDDYRQASVVVYELKPAPILTHSWTSKWEGFKLALTVIVKNLGTDTARGYQIKVGFDAGDNTWWNSKSSDSFDLAMGREYTVTLVLQPPEDKYTRLIIQVVNPSGKYVDISYSKWFNT